MNGELGVLYQEEKQVGGLYGWEIDFAYDSTVSNGWREFKITKGISAASYWLNFVPDGNCFDIKLYKAIRGQLVLVDSGKVMINLPSVRIFDTKLNIPIEIRWIGN